MRRLPLLLSAAIFFAVPAMAVNAPKSVTPPVPPAAPAAPAAKTETPPANAAAAGTFTDAQRSEIEDIIKDYLTQKNPEVLMDAMKELQKRETADADAKSKTALASDRDKLYNDAKTPVGGNPKGSINVVEFFDYQCGYCRMSEPSVEKLLKENKDVRLIYKDYPILGPVSTEAAKAALAAARQGKYVQMHDKLMTAPLPHGASDPHAGDEAIFKAAKDAGLDLAKLKSDMNDPSIDKQIEDNVSLGMDVGARGTPTFIIGDSVYPGALEYDQMKKMVEAEAAKPDATKKP